MKFLYLSMLCAIVVGWWRKEKGRPAGVLLLVVSSVLAIAVGVYFSFIHRETPAVLRNETTLLAAVAEQAGAYLAARFPDAPIYVLTVPVGVPGGVQRRLDPMEESALDGLARGRNVPRSQFHPLPMVLPGKPEPEDDVAVDHRSLAGIVARAANYDAWFKATMFESMLRDVPTGAVIVAVPPLPFSPRAVPAIKTGTHALILLQTWGDDPRDLFQAAGLMGVAARGSGHQAWDSIVPGTPIQVGGGRPVTLLSRSP